MYRPESRTGLSGRRKCWILNLVHILSQQRSKDSLLPHITFRMSSCGLHSSVVPQRCCSWDEVHADIQTRAFGGGRILRHTWWRRGADRGFVASGVQIQRRE